MAIQLLRYVPWRAFAVGAIAAVTALSGVLGTPVAGAVGTGAVSKSLPLATAATTTFWYTGTEQTYLVPAGTTWVTITAAGAIGGGDYYNAMPGGGSAVVTATVPLAPGTTTLYVVVGGAGSSPVSDRSGAPGGFNGGGASIISWGGSGGGASDVRTQQTSVPLTDTDSRLVVAGGGGGAGSGYGSGGDAGGAGYASVTGAGAGGSGDDSSATGARAGNGGFGGTMGGVAGALAPSAVGSASAAAAGQLGQGGASSAGSVGELTTYVTFAGGGGGGFFGGGGGGDGTYGGGGGAGSSYWVREAVNTSMAANAGAAYISITPLAAPKSQVTLKLTKYASLAGKYRRYPFGRAIVCKGAVTPDHALLADATTQGAVMIQAWCQKGGKWVSVKKVTRKLSSASTYSWSSWKPRRGAYKLRTSFAGDADHSASTSPIRYAKVY